MFGVIICGQCQIGGQGLFCFEDNFESFYVWVVLCQFYFLLVCGKVEGCLLEWFEIVIGLKLMDLNGIKDELLLIIIFFNCLLVLIIELQGIFFIVFEQLLDVKVEGVMVVGIYDLGFEMLKVESFVVIDWQVIYFYFGIGVEMRFLIIIEWWCNMFLLFDVVFDELDDLCVVLLVNS